MQSVHYFRPILTKTGNFRLILAKLSNTKSDENPSTGSRVVPRRQTDRYGEDDGFFFCNFLITTKSGEFEAKNRRPNIFLKLHVIWEVNTNCRHFTQFPETRDQLTEIDGRTQITQVASRGQIQGKNFASLPSDSQMFACQWNRHIIVEPCLHATSQSCVYVICARTCSPSDSSALVTVTKRTGSQPLLSKSTSLLDCHDGWRHKLAREPGDCEGQSDDRGGIPGDSL